jgi:uncharacterized membrane protein
MKVFSYPILTVIALIGFAISFYIWNKKSRQKPLVCPMKGNCAAVIHSDYSKFMGVRVEILGMIYYSLICIAYGMLFFFPQLSTSWTLVVLRACSAAAFLFSLYLASVQIFVLKQFCTWCLCSALVSAILFLSVMMR